ncbi:sorbitol dehydrogenase-like [Uloborus diversus]|uniref:sorbitol dehydrogenase-like n=1 Tax=Uloborus diversus TaxID=327109 RepID=UPI00240A0C89|nr:sorbitol dehydrogenase-like [Uloborus diversus]
MAAKNLNVVLKQKGQLVLEDRPIPTPGPDEVLVRIHSVGICGSDVHFWKNGRVAHFVVENIVLGHEASGTVVGVGSRVHTLKTGDRVCLEPGGACHLCEFCKGGHYNLCPQGAQQVDGSMCHYYVHPASLCFKLPDNVTLEQGALVEPLAVAVHTCRRASVSPGKTILITGSGAIGLCNLLIARAFGATKIIMTDICPGRLELAKKLGATHQVCVRDKSEELVSEEIKCLLGGCPDITLECSGAQSCIQLSLKVTKSGGTVVLVGLGSPEVTLPMPEVVNRELEVRGVFRYTDCYPTVLGLLSCGALDVGPLMTHRFGIQDAEEAFRVSQGGLEGAVKVLVGCE